jgi:hypothetical protein
MQHAKTEDMYAGGHTDAVVIRADGTCAWASREEMKAAEEFSPRIDSLIHQCCVDLLSQKSEAAQKEFVERFSYLYLLFT